MLYAYHHWSSIARPTNSHLFQLVGTFFQPDRIKTLVSNLPDRSPVVLYFDKNNIADKNAIAVVVYDNDQDEFYVVGFIAKVDQERFLKQAKFLESCATSKSDYDLSKVQLPSITDSGYIDFSKMTSPGIQRIEGDDLTNYVFYGNLVRWGKGYGKDNVSISLIPPHEVKPTRVDDSVHNNFYRGTGERCAPLTGSAITAKHEPKYKLDYDTHISYRGRVLYQIVATKDFVTRPGYQIDIYTGARGGYIEKESNLSQFGNCWVHQGCRVYDNAIVREDAIIAGESEVWGNAVVRGRAQIGNTSEITDDAIIRGDAVIAGDSCVGGSKLISTGRHIDVHFDDEW